MIVYFKKVFARCTLDTRGKIRLPYRILHRRNMNFWGNKANVKIKENSTQKEGCLGIITPYIRTQIYHIIDGWKYCKFLEGY